MINLLEKWRSRVSITKPKTKKMRLTIGFQVEYDAPLSYYDEETQKDPQKMAETDSESAKANPFQALRAFVKFPGARMSVKVEPVLTVGQKAGLEIQE